jgi:hypothetical protein
MLRNFSQWMVVNTERMKPIAGEKERGLKRKDQMLNLGFQLRVAGRSSASKRD